MTIMSSSLCCSVVCAALFIRILVGYQPHSGQDNHHGSKVAYGGDYEAQRHWLEITWNLPIGDWYWYDLQYWGLDYPPLTAYVSYICGAFSEWLVGPETVALDTSRGYETDVTHKAYMRATVWVLEAMIYFPAAYFILKVLWQCRLKSSSSTATNKSTTSSNQGGNFPSTYLLALLQPSIILIDHGHFQYNTVALGLTLWSLYCITHTNFYWSCIWGSVFFSLALNFKQMTLYYAPVIFAYLLGRCFAGSSSNNNNPLAVKKGGTSFFSRFVALGVTVIVTFGILWWPFLVYGPSHKNSLRMDTSSEGSNSTVSLIAQRGKHVLRRIFPLERGLFEGKVSNLWCALDTKPINIRDRIPSSIQPLAALVVTVLLMMPSCVKLFMIGKQSELESKSPQQQQTQRYAHDLKAMLCGSTSCALAFFLASFQVHEKSILLALAPASLLAWDDTLFCDWFAIVAAWTMWPLLVVDRLQVAYVCAITIFLVGVMHLRETDASCQDKETSPSAVGWCWKILIKLSVVAMLGLHGLEMAITVPSHLPDLFPVLWSVGGCALCCLAWARTVGALWVIHLESHDDQKSKLE